MNLQRKFKCRTPGEDHHLLLSPPIHRAIWRDSVFLQRSGNMELHVSVMFTFCGNVKDSSQRNAVTFLERKCQVTFPRFPSLFVSATFLQTDSQLCATFTKRQRKMVFLNNNIVTSKRRTTWSCSHRKYLTSHLVKWQTCFRNETSTETWQKRVSEA